MGITSLFEDGDIIAYPYYLSIGDLLAILRGRLASFQREAGWLKNFLSRWSENQAKKLFKHPSKCKRHTGGVEN